MQFSKNLLAPLGAALLISVPGAAQALSIATYTFDDSAVADTLLGWSGDFQNYASGGAAISGAQLEADITDLNGATWVAGLTGYETLDLRFGGTTVINGDGVDLAVFMIGQGTSVMVELIDHPGAPSLIYNGVYTGTDYSYQTDLFGLQVAEIDLSDFGLAPGEALGDLRVDGWSSVSLVGAFNTSLTPVPLPAGAWLLGSGLLGMAAAGRRRRGR